jgi:hypothetical protein
MCDCISRFNDREGEKAEIFEKVSKSFATHPSALNRLFLVLPSRIITSDILIVRYLSFNAEQEHRQSCLFVEITGYTAQTCCED